MKPIKEITLDLSMLESLDRQGLVMLHACAMGLAAIASARLALMPAAAIAPAPAPLMTVAQFAARVALAPATIYEMVREGNLNCIKRGKTVRFSEANYADYMENKPKPSLSTEPKRADYNLLLGITPRKEKRK